MHVHVVLLAILALAILVLAGLRAILRQTVEDSPYTAPVAPGTDPPPATVRDDSSRMGSESR